VYVTDLYPSTQKSLDEAKGSVIADFQTEKESIWLETLRAKYKIVINQEELNHIKSIIN